MEETGGIKIVEVQIMRIVIINGQNHKGSTRMIARDLAEKVIQRDGGEIREFFLPRDFDEPCIGCGTCFRTELSRCPHHEKLQPITESLEWADLIILASPVYVYHATGQMKALLDHYGTQWMVHRPKECMFHKQSVCVSTAAGAGMKSTNRDMADSLRFWGVPKIYKMGVAVRAMGPDEIPQKIREKIDRSTDRLTDKIVRNKDPRTPSLNGRIWFHAMRFMHAHVAPMEPDYSYWKERDWDKKNRPWK